MQIVAGTGVPSQPKWMRDVGRLTSVRSQFILAGNIRDLVFNGKSSAPVSVLDALFGFMSEAGAKYILVWDIVDGLSPHPNTAETRQQAKLDFELEIPAGGSNPISLERLAELIKRATQLREVKTAEGEADFIAPPRTAIVIDFASRLTADPERSPEKERLFFIACEKYALNAAPFKVSAVAGAMPTFNPVFWLTNAERDLPSWLSVNNPRVHNIAVSLPDMDARRSMALASAGQLQIPNDPPNLRVAFANEVASLSDQMTLRGVLDVIRLAAANDISAEDIDEAVTSYKVGDLNFKSPWRGNGLRDQIAAAEKSNEIHKRVLGQQTAVTKTLDILKRSSFGLSGAQAKSSGSRPKGVLFFAGPTGVGKTELAKTITKMIFGDETAYLRFDMSEFSAEHSDARLIGSPPGYVGNREGGELTNAVRDRPFRVILFDEIEKANPRILDKFLQILEDGRLTDGRGETVYFSQSLIIFTSNVGIFEVLKDGTKVQNVFPADMPGQVEKTVREKIGDFFTYTLGRPEILNRLGDNIVVFQFITHEVGAQILESMVSNVANRLLEENDTSVSFSQAAKGALAEHCLADLSHGGRGIGNKLESVLINPLARALFARGTSVGDRIEVERVTRNDDGTFSVSLRGL